MAARTLNSNTYTDAAGRLRELVIRPGAHSSLLVLDRDPATLCDRRLVAHIPADEPAENALLICRMYMREAGGRPCRRLTAEDLVSAPMASAEDERNRRDRTGERGEGEFLGCGIPHVARVHGLEVAYALLPQPARPPELRWHRRAVGKPAWVPITLREALGELERYEPLCRFTLRAIARQEHARAQERASGRGYVRGEGHVRGQGYVRGEEHAQEVSVAALRREYGRLQESPMVLNRRLREAVLGAVRRNEATLSEIAMRCGMLKRDRRGRLVGDTSWLARRVGLRPESGRRAANCWVHSDTLALIAREGLGVSPREVEL